MITSGALEFCILTSSWRTALYIKFDRHSCYPAEMLLTGLLTLEILSTLRLTQTSGGTVTAGLVPDIPTADGSPKLVWLQEAPVSVLNQIWKQTHSLSYQSTKIGAGRSQLNITAVLMIESSLQSCLWRGWVIINGDVQPEVVISWNAELGPPNIKWEVWTRYF